MSKLFNKLKAGLEDAVAHKQGKLNLRSETIVLPEAPDLVKNRKKQKSTFERVMEAKTPAQRKKYEEGHQEFLLSEIILAQETTMSKRPTFAEFKKRAMQNEKFRAEYELLEEEFAMLEKAIKERKKPLVYKQSSRKNI